MKLQDKTVNFITTGKLSKLINVSVRTILRHPKDYPPLYRMRPNSDRYAATEDVNIYIKSRGQFKTLEEYKRSII